MATITHTFVSAIPDHPQSLADGKICPQAHWNADHTIVLGSDENFVTDAQLTVIGNTSGTNTGDQTITLTGDVTGSGTGSFAATIANSAVSTAKLGGDITTAGKALLDDADAAAQRVTLGISTRAIPFGCVGTVADGTIKITYFPFAGTINSVQNIYTSAGTVTVAIKINGTNVTGLSAISVTSSSQDVNATAANTVAVGDEVTIVMSSA